MANEYAAPINHSAGSAVVNTVGGTAGGAIKGGVKWGVAWTGLMALAGIATAVAISGIGIGAIALGIIGGGIVGASTAPFFGVIGAAVGGVRGGAHASSRVRNERAAHAELQAQVQVAKAAAMAPVMAAQQSPLAAQGSAMNAAGSRINNVQYDGVGLGGPQLANGMGR